MKLDDIIGNEDVKYQIIKSIDAGRFSHAHIIVGEDGIGKSLIARATALKILNETEDKDYPDIINWRPLKNRKSIGVEQIRNLIEEIYKKPFNGDKKVIIVYEADKMTVQAQNAFLKTIEEPPTGVYIILLCENIEKILETIKSRCQIYNMRPLKQDEIIKFISRKYRNIEESKIKIAAAFSEGIPGRAEKFLSDDTYNEIRNLTLELLFSITKLNKFEILKYEEYFLKYKDKQEEILNCILMYIRDTIIYKEIGNEELIINKDKVDSIRELANIFSFKKLNNIVKLIEDVLSNTNTNLNELLIFYTMLIKLQEV